MTRTQTVHDGFMLGSPLATPHNPGYKASFFSAFVAYRETVTVTTHVSINTGYRFSASARARPRTQDPVRALFERTREHPAGAMLFEQTAYRASTSIVVLYFGYACHQSLASTQRRGAAPSPKPIAVQTPRQVAERNAPAAPAATSFEPVPQAANLPAPAPVRASSAPAPERPVATASLKPIEPSKPSDPFDWVKLPNREIGHRYEVWNALGREKPARVEVSLKASPKEPKIVTPRKIDGQGMSFSAVNADGTPEEIAFGDVNNVRVLSA